MAENSADSRDRAWFRALTLDELEEGRVKPVTCGLQTVCMTHHKGRYAALDNRCPHQGGPLGEGSIENGLLRCPWHGWDYDPLTGKPPGGYDDGVETYPVEIREHGVYVGFDVPKPHTRTASDVMAETMVAWGVKHVFGMVGHSNLGLADALRRQAEAGRASLTYIGMRHEGRRRLRGRRPSASSPAGRRRASTIAGPRRDQPPDGDVGRQGGPGAGALALTGQVDTQVLGPGAFQEIDLQAAYGKVAQWSQPVLHSSRHAELMNLACKSALLNRGVAHLIFPDEVQNLAAAAAPAGAPDGRITQREIHPPEESLAKAVGMLRGARRPVIIVGYGARFHMAPVVELAEKLGAPIITTFKGKGLISDSHPLAGGVLGRSGTPIASWLMNESDLLLVFGASFSNHTGITPKKPTIQVDFDPLALGRFHAIDAPVWGEIGVSAKLMKDALSAGETSSEDQRPDVAERWRLWRREKAGRERDSHSAGIASAALFAVLNRLVPEDAIMPVDVGNNTYSFGRYFESRRQAVLMSGYLGSIGFGFPAGMGAWAATQEQDSPFAGRKVVSISGDGGFGQYMGELLTAVKYGMNITHILLNNCELGKISKEQRSGNWDVWQTSLHNPDFSKYAELCGAAGFRVEHKEGLDDAIGRALEHPGPSLVEVRTDPQLV